jgi:hypothetical protein
MMTRAVCCIAALIAGAAAFADDGGTPDSVDPDAPTVGASLDKTEAHVGDRVTLTLSAVAKAGFAVTLPPKLELGKLELLDRDDGDKQGRDLGDGRRAHRFVLGVAAYEVGELEVPALAISYINPRGEVRTVQTAPVTLEVKGLLAPDEANPEVQPIRQPRSAIVEDKRVMKLARWGAVGLGGALLVGILALIIRRSLRRAVAAAPVELLPSRPPEEIAMEKLRLLRAQGNFGADGYRPFSFAVAEVVRAYLGGRYGFDSLELTTTELMGELEKRAAHLALADGAVARFLGDTDLVKFARSGSTDEAALAALDAAQSIVLSTAAPLETVVAATSGPVRLPMPPATPTPPPKEGSGG